MKKSELNSEISNKQLCIDLHCKAYELVVSPFECDKIVRFE